MEDLGKLQSTVKGQIRKALEADDGRTLGRLGPVLADMEKKAYEWALAVNAPHNGVTSSPTPVATPPSANSGLPEFAGKQVYSVTALGTKVPVGSYKHALFSVVEQVQKKHADFDQLAIHVRGRGPYFSVNPTDLRKPERLQNSKLFIETNVGADRIWDICQRLLHTFGHNPDDPAELSFEVAPTRTRAQKRRRAKAGATTW